MVPIVCFVACAICFPSSFIVTTMSSFDSDSDDNLLLQMLEEDKKKRKQKMKQLAALLLAATIPVALDDCDSPFFHEHLNWTEHIAELNNEGPNAFFLMYTRMHYHSYMKFVHSSILLSKRMLTWLTERLAIFILSLLLV